MPVITAATRAKLPRKPRQHTEHHEQVLFFQRVDLDPRTRSMPIFAVPNAARRSPRQGAWMKAEGMRAGVPDVMVCVSRGTVTGLALEFKAEGNGTTPAQKEWAARLNLCGWQYRVTYTADEAWTILCHYLEIPR